ncbi:hypothetical protein LTR86_003596 [Recurvomyces mirabilis]|nr:hypothetical protein LTR86_003596 [Recurvomyces mirabilis]
MRVMLREGIDPDAVYDIKDAGYLMQLTRPSRPRRVRGPEGHRPGTLDPISSMTRGAVGEVAQAEGRDSLSENGLRDKFWNAVVLDMTPEELSQASIPKHEDPEVTLTITMPEAVDDEHE